MTVLPDNPEPGFVDVHAHFIPAEYRRALIAAGHSRPDGMPALPGWSREGALALMDRLGVRTALLSISSPGVHFGDDAAARALARGVNESGARLAEENPGRFGFFASLPLPDVAGAVAESVYALDILKADGVVLETNQRGLYLGDARLERLYAELDRRGAVVFIHPTSPHCACGADLARAYPAPMLEFMFETTRAVADMILSGVAHRHPRIRWIVPHGGAALSIFAERIVGVVGLLKLSSGVTGEEFRASLRELYYDLAGAPLPAQLPALLQIADAGRLLYGSDAPFTPAPAVLAARDALFRDGPLSQAQRLAVFGGNARALFPRLSAGFAPLAS
jgi:predicted TIM-barrel fold metal-dependent hydrolase